MRESITDEQGSSQLTIKSEYCPQIIAKQIDILEYPEKQYFRDKVASCEFLSLLGEALQTVPDLLIGYQANVISVLEDTMSDRVLKVQQAARNTVKKWKEFENVYFIMEEKKATLDVDLAGLTPDEILHIRTGIDETPNESLYWTV
jgi:hypothetical protein